MGLKVLETTVSTNGFLSGALNVSDSGVVLKFSRGGFSNESNGVVNNAFVAPIPDISSTKSSKIYAPPADQVTNLSNVQTDQNLQNFINNKYSIDPFTPEVLAVYSFTKNEIDSLLAASYQSYFEDKCSLEFSKAFIKKAMLTNQKPLETLSNSFKDEIAKTEKQLNTIESFVNSCLEIDKALTNKQALPISTLFLENFQFLNPDKLGLSGRGGTDPVSILSYVTAGSNFVAMKSNTAIMTQLLALTANHFTNGSTSLILGDSKVYPGNLVSPNAENDSTFVELKTSNNEYLNLKSLSMSSNTQQSFLYKNKEDISYIEKLRLDTLKAGSYFQKSAYLMCLLANEFALSSGLGRLEGTQLGQSFNSTGNYVRNFLGAGDYSEATTETSYPGSLADYFVVNENGTSTLNSSKGVLLYDGSTFNSTNTRFNVFDAFIAGAIRQPLSKEKNKVAEFSVAETSANTRFKLGLEFYKQLHNRDKKLILLTPRGLFTRLIEDISSLMKNLQSQDTSSNQVSKELAIFSLLARTSRSQLDKNSPANVIKRAVLAVMAKKAIQIQYSLDTAKPLSTSTESQKSQQSSSSTKVTVDDGKEKKTSIVTSEQVGSTTAPGTKGSSTQFIANPKNPRLSNDEAGLLAQVVDFAVTDELVKSFGKLPISNKPNQSSYIKITSTVESLFSSFFTQQNGLLDKLVKIYTDLCDEANKICSEDASNASIVSPNRLTKNSKIDGAICLSMILESALMLLGEFVDSGIELSPLIELIDVFGNANVNLKNFATFTFEMYVNSGDLTQTTLASRSLQAIANASKGDDFSSLFLEKNQNVVLPEIGGLSPNTIISYDGQSQLSISSVIDTFYDLNFERELPAMCLSSVAAMVGHFSNSSAKYRDVANQILGNTKQTDDVKSLVTFAKSSIGNDYLASLNDFSLESSRKRLNNLKSALNSESGRNPKLTLGEQRCIEIVLPLQASSINTVNFVVAALPKDFVLKSLNRTYSVSSDKSNPLSDSIMSVNVEKAPIFTGEIQQALYDFMIRSPFNSDSFSIFEKNAPTGIQDILNNVIVDGNKTGLQFVNEKQSTDFARQVLYNEIVSYLLRKMFSVLSSADLFSENVVDLDLFPLSSDSATTAKIFASVRGLSSSAFDGVFSTTADGLTYIDEDQLIKLSTNDFRLSENSLDLSISPLSFGEAELFYDLFNTVYFQLGTAMRQVFSPSILDETLGLCVSDANFSEMMPELSTLTLDGSITMTDSKKLIAKQIPTFNTYNVSLKSSQSLVNK